jgi:hypothetical protein
MTDQNDLKHLSNAIGYLVEVVKLACYCLITPLLLRDKIITLNIYKIGHSKNS